MKLHPGHTLQLNRRQWTLRRVRLLGPQRLELEAIGASEAAMGMTRRMAAVQFGPALFIEQRRGGYWQANLETDWRSGDFGPILNFTPATRLDLLDAHTRIPAAGDLPNQFSWSYSRDALFQRCARAYYYHYYAAWEGWQRDAPPPVQRAYLLKNLTDIPRWVGALVHDAIKFALNRLQSGAVVPPAEIVANMRQRARADVESSQQELYRQQPNRYVGFLEHYYRANLPKSAWTEAWAQAEQRLWTFLDSPLYAHLQRQPPETFLQVESLQSFTVADTKVWVQLDLARRESDAIYLYDWKSGGVDATAVRQQLGIYGLFVRQRWPEWRQTPLKGIVFDLAENAVLEIDLSDEALAPAKARAEASIAALRQRLLDPAQNLAELRRFPMIDDLTVCGGCRFRELCGRAD